MSPENLLFFEVQGTDGGIACSTDIVSQLHWLPHSQVGPETRTEESIKWHKASVMSRSCLPALLHLLQFFGAKPEDIDPQLTGHCMTP